MLFRSESMTQQSTIAGINAEYSQAKLQLDTDEVLGKQGLVPDLMLKMSRMHVQDLANRLKVEQQRLAVGARSTKAQVSAQQARISQFRALAKLRKEQAAGLKVRAGTSGVLQEVSVQVGQQVTPGFNIARVADPNSLKAELNRRPQAGYESFTRLYRDMSQLRTFCANGVRCAVCTILRHCEF